MSRHSYLSLPENTQQSSHSQRQNACVDGNRKHPFHFLFDLHVSKDQALRRDASMAWRVQVSGFPVSHAHVQINNMRGREQTSDAAALMPDVSAPEEVHVSTRSIGRWIDLPACFEEISPMFLLFFRNSFPVLMRSTKAMCPFVHASTYVSSLLQLITIKGEGSVGSQQTSSVSSLMFFKRSPASLKCEAVIDLWSLWVSYHFRAVNLMCLLSFANDLCGVCMCCVSICAPRQYVEPCHGV